mgnify:CR=1 FL=1
MRVEEGPAVVRVALAGACALALAPAAAGVPDRANAALGVVAIERVTDGRPGARPTLGLLARADDGAGGDPGVSLGEVSFTLDARQIDRRALTRLMDAPAGTRFGWVTLSPNGPTSVQSALRTKAGSFGDVLTAAWEVPREFAGMVGASGPVRIRTDASTVTVTLDFRSLVERWRRATRTEIPWGGGLIGIYLDSYADDGTTRHLAVNPTRRTTLMLKATARPCVDRPCTVLGEPVADRLILSLPHTFSVRAPVRATYGRRATFTGVGAPGDSVHLAYVKQTGRRPLCTPTNFAKQPPCSPAFGAAYERLAPTTTVRRDGTWTLRVVLRSVDRSAIGFAHGASGRYAAVAYRGARPVNYPSFNGGRFSVLTPAAVRTEVVLARPRVSVRASGRTVSFTIDVPGGDSHVTVRISVDGKRLIAARLDAAGSAKVRVRLPPRIDRIAVTASAPGAAPSRMTTTVPTTR